MNWLALILTIILIGYLVQWYWIMEKRQMRQDKLEREAVAKWPSVGDRKGTK